MQMKCIIYSSLSNNLCNCVALALLAVGTGRYLKIEIDLYPEIDSVMEGRGHRKDFLIEIDQIHVKEQDRAVLDHTK